MSVSILAYFSNKGTPVIGLSPLVTIYNVADGTTVVSAAAMTEVGEGGYSYLFSSYSASINYCFTCDGGVTLSALERYVPGTSIGVGLFSGLVISYFSNLGVPATGLSPTVTIYDVSNGDVLINAAAMTEVAGGFYKYDFTTFSTSGDYHIVSDGGVGLAPPERYAIGSSRQEAFIEIANISVDVEVENEIDITVAADEEISVIVEVV